MKMKSLTLVGLVCFGVVYSGEGLASAAVTLVNNTQYTTAIACNSAHALIFSHRQSTLHLSDELCQVNVVGAAGKIISAGTISYQVWQDKINFIWTFGKSSQGPFLLASGVINGVKWTAGQGPGDQLAYYSDDILPKSTDVINVTLSTKI